jgi:thioredoxin 1
MPSPLIPKRRGTALILSEADIESFVAENSVAAIHFDAVWDVSGLASIQPKLEEAESVFGGQVAFGFVDCDTSPELAKAIPILNVPTVAYYRNGKIVAALIGAQQNVLLRLQHLLRGEEVGYKDGGDF